MENNLQVYSFFTIKVIVNLHDEIQKSTIASNRRKVKIENDMEGSEGRIWNFSLQKHKSRRSYLVEGKVKIVKNLEGCLG